MWTKKNVLKNATDRRVRSLKAFSTVSAVNRFKSKKRESIRGRTRNRAKINNEITKNNKSMVKKSSEGETTTTPQSQCDSNSTDSTVQDQSGSTSNVPIASTESYSWCEILRRTRAQEQSVEAGKHFWGIFGISYLKSCIFEGMVLCICAMGLNYGSIFFDVFNVEDSTGWFKEIGCHSSTAGCSIIISVTWYVGAIAGSIFCGLKQITWPARMTNVRWIVNKFI